MNFNLIRLSFCYCCYSEGPAALNTGRINEFIGISDHYTVMLPDQPGENDLNSLISFTGIYLPLLSLLISETATEGSWV